MTNASSRWNKSAASRWSSLGTESFSARYVAKRDAKSAVSPARKVQKPINLFLPSSVAVSGCAGHLSDGTLYFLLAIMSHPFLVLQGLSILLLFLRNGQGHPSRHGHPLRRTRWRGGRREPATPKGAAADPPLHRLPSLYRKRGAVHQIQRQTGRTTV